MRRGAVVVGTAAAMTVGLGVAGVTYLASSGDSEASAQEPTDTTPPAETATVQRTDLVRTQDVDGTLTYGERSELAASGGGTLTALPAEGSVIERGGVLWYVDGHAGPVLMYGDLPMWRDLSNSSDDGPDIRQLEENLVALGFADPAEMTVDEEFTWATAEAVERWQESLGLDDTGEVAQDDIIFRDSPVRIASQLLREGAAAEGGVVEVTGTTRRVHVDLDASDAGLVSQGAPVEVELADGTTVDGTIAEIATTAEVQEGQDGQGSTTTLDVEIDVAGDVQALDESPVDVSLVSSRAEGVLAVPVQALLALAEGGYAVERVNGDGTTSLVPVELGTFADDLVEVTGELAEGDEVVLA